MKIILLLVWSVLTFAADILELVHILDQNDNARFEKVVTNAFEANTAREDNNKTVLMYAVWVGNNNAVRHLVSKGADVNAADNSGATALHLAIWKDQTDIALFLIQNGASSRAMSIDGMTPRDIATIRQNLPLLEAMDKSTAGLKSLPLD